ncbi:flagellar hook assembly protein FlgD [Paramicrobacterium agarici]|uniref:Flagellar basal-body rod modification protein FlgD n=1 Tax=Paramicrobacterium agarici TaxID=630514 RepID=A0A2A9DX82_9MICO|nr:flagellar hook capping FlgD N-terminal domain-containing protein [Microbacterium agarici]PFG30602.1 flagellar basal-body rod modification protein FlgD [Microbacterium agarici]TQO23620.1 flagellar basal-body rod modification protein FlgD [Microbacterium agarici]
MPTVEPVASTGLYTSTVTPAQDRKQTLDSEVFMQLLVTQLKNQDPSSPMNTNEMISQTTQLAMMEQLTAMATTSNENFALSMRQTAAALVGQQASYLDADGNEVSGLVSSVSFAESVPQVTIGDTTVPLDAVSGISTAS